MKEASFYKKIGKKKVQCFLCPRHCMIIEGKTGFCGVRKNIGGVLQSLVYARPCSIAIDPIEKKPFFQFAPGSHSLSIATVGCNLNCSFCQNWEISHPRNVKDIISACEHVPPESVVKIAKERRVEGISYTYTEPTIFFEYAYDTMKFAKKAGLYNTWVSNGYTSPEPAKKASKYLDAINVDLKGDMKFYQKLCSVPNEEPMHESLKICKENGVWIEVTNLIIPGYNDSEKTILGIVRWVKKNLGEETPMHFSRFYPHRNLTDVPPTPQETLEKAVKLASKEGMHYVYLGNVWGHKNESTYCWKCGEVLIDRRGYEIVSIKKKCPKCGEKLLIAGERWSRFK